MQKSSRKTEAFFLLAFFLEVATLNEQKKAAEKICSFLWP
jgi:hypothetical protein